MPSSTAPEHHPPPEDVLPEGLSHVVARMLRRVTWSFSHCPAIVIWVQVAIFFIVAGVLGGTNAFVFAQQSSNDYLIRDRLDVERYQAVTKAREDLSSDSTDDAVVPERSLAYRDFDLLLLTHAEVSGEDLLLDDDNLKTVYELQAKVARDKGYLSVCRLAAETGRCVLPLSAVAWPDDVIALYDNSSAGIPQVRPGDDRATKESVLQYYADAIEDDPDTGGLAVLRPLLFDIDFGKSEGGGKRLKSRFLRALFYGGMPLKGYDNEGDKEDEQREKYTEAIDSLVQFINFERFNKDPAPDGVEAILTGGRLGQAIFEETTFTDLYWAAGTIVFVLTYLSFHTSSLFIGVVGLIQVIVSMPYAFVIYKYVFGIGFFQTLHTLSIFIILAIGADNLFLFYDAFEQAPTSRLAAQGDASHMHERIHFAFVRASKSAFVTSFTTMAAFLATFNSEIMPISTFGLFSAVVVVMNYILDLCFFPAILVVWLRYIQPLEHGLFLSLLRRNSSDQESDGGIDQSKSQGITYDDVEEAKSSPEGSNTTKQSSFGEGAKPSPEKSTTTKQSSFGEGAKPSPEKSTTTTTKQSASSSIPRSSSVLPPETPLPTKHHTLDPSHLRPIERFFHTTWTDFVFRVRYGIIVLFTVVTALAAWQASRLRPLSKQEEWFPQRHFLGRSGKWLDENFGTTERDATVQAHITWGILGIDREGTTRYEPDDVGEPIYDSKFDPTTPAAQTFLNDTCYALADLEIVREIASCWIDDYGKWRVDNGHAFPFVADATAGEDQYDAFVEDLLAFSRDLDSTGPELRSQGKFGIDDSNKIRFVQISASTELLRFEPLDTNLPYYDKLESFVADRNKDAPEEVSRAFQTAGVSWAWMRTERALVTGAIFGIILSLAVAFSVLVLSTTNIFVGLYATVSIVGIVTWVLGLQGALGYEFGTSESVSAVILIGLAVDASVHIGVHYVTSPRPDRLEKVREALTEMGVSITAGVATSAGGGLFMFGGTIIFFFKFAILIVCSLTISLLFAISFLPAVLMIIGPENDAGSLLYLLEYCQRKKPQQEQQQPEKSQAPNPTHEIA